MALALISKLEDAELWRREMTAAIPGLDFRVWPELGDERQIRMAAFDFNLAPPGIFQRMPDLGCIVYLGHGANDFLQRPDLPKGVPVMRLKDPGIIGYMTEYVLLHLLSHRRLQATYRRQQAERRWQGHIPPFPGEVAVAVLGLGSIGQRVAALFASLGYRVHGWARGPHELPGVACYHGREAAAAAQSQWVRQFSIGDDPDEVPVVSIAAAEFIDGRIGLIRLLALVGLTRSNNEARQKIQEGAVTIGPDRKKMTDPKATVTVTDGLIIRLGSRHIRQVRLG